EEGARGYDGVVTELAHGSSSRQPRAIPDRSGLVVREWSGAHARRLARPRGLQSRGLSALERLVAELREHALVIGEVTLTSGRRGQYYVDAKRAILRPDGFRALGEL